MLRTFSLSVAVLCAGPALAAPYDGRWQMEGAKCVGFEPDAKPVEIGKGKVKFYESECDVGRTLKGTTTLLCAGEAEEWKMTLKPFGSKLLIAYEGEKANTYRRCK